MNYMEESLRLHGEWKGKIEVVSRVPVKNKEDLSLAYTPGVAQPCLEIQKDYDKSFTLTRRHNLVAVITDGTAVLGLGDVGPEAGMPVMEGKCALFKAFADMNPAQAQHRGTVGDDRAQVVAASQLVGLVHVLLDLQAGLGHARGVGEAQLVLVVHGHPGDDLDLALPFPVQAERFFCVIHEKLSPYRLMTFGRVGPP